MKIYKKVDNGASILEIDTILIEEYKKYGYKILIEDTLPDINISQTYKTNYIDYGEYVKCEYTIINKSNELLNIEYKALVTKYIREKYTLDDELAIHRQQNTDNEAFIKYFNYCEDCKVKAKQEFDITIPDGAPYYISENDIESIPTYPTN